MARLRMVVMAFVLAEAILLLNPVQAVLAHYRSWHLDLNARGDFLYLNLPSLGLQVWREGQLRAVFPVAIGRLGQETPVGYYRIETRRTWPTWYPPQGGEPVPPGPANPLGSRFLGLNLPMYGLHGTNDPASIGRAVSRGCIRLREEDIRRLWALTYPGMPVRIAYERVQATSGPWGSSLLLWPDVYRRQPVKPSHLVKAVPPLAREMRLAAEALSLVEDGPVLVVMAGAPSSISLHVRGKGVVREASN